MEEFRNNTENSSEEVLSPFDSLKKRMSLDNQEVKKDDAPLSEGFTVTKGEEDDFSAPSFIGAQTEDAVSTEASFAEPPIEEEPKKPKSSILKRIRRYTTDDNGVDVTKEEKPLYELDSVNSILGIETEEEPQEIIDEEPVITEEEEAATDNTTPFISDIDMPDFDVPVYDKPATSNTATIRFTPVSDELTKKTTVSVDTMTHRIDLSGELTESNNENTVKEQNFEQSEFEKYVPSEEITDKKSEKKFLRNFALKKRNRFLCSVASGLLSLVLFIFLLPPISNSMLYESTGLMIASTVILGILVLINADMFLSFSKIKSSKQTNDINAALLSVSTLLLAVFSILNEVDSFPMIFICAFILFIRSLMKFYDASNLCDNLRIIAVNRPKKAVNLISDTSTAYAMAKNSIEGDVLIATSNQTDRVADFMKYSEYGQKLFGKINLITFISLLLSAVCAVIAGMIKQSVVEAFYMSSVILSLTAIPIVFFIDSLPLRSMVSRLNKKGAMLTGFTAAEHLNASNAVVIRTADLFPSGTVVLKDMKVLSDNNVDDVILRAASLTDALSSPLSSIFKQIAKTNAAYDVPDSDTVKYEERLGLSGWVNNERLYIGNRTLMEAHGIEVPSLEVDRSILQKGYFPIYVSKDNTACVLLIVKYTVDPLVAQRLRETANLGITVLLDNNDPNITSEMVCDYFGLEDNSVYVMTSVGSNIHKNATAYMEECSAGTAYKGNTLSLLEILISAAKLKKSNTVLTVIYCIAAILGLVYFIYSSFLANTSLIEQATTVLIYEIAATAVSLTAFLIKRP